MAKHHNPKIVTSNLVFAYDTGNDIKSWKGMPTTNILASPSDFTSASWTKTMNSGTVPSVTTENISDRYGNIKSVDKLILPSDGTYPRIYQSWTPASTATHTFSIWMKSKGGSQTKCEIVIFRNSPWQSPSGIITANLTSSWQRYTVSFTPLDTTAHQIYIGSHDTAKGAIVYLDDAQLEVNSFASPYVSGTRTNTQSLIDLTNANTLTLNAPTYNSDGSFTLTGLDGSNVSIPNIDLRTNFSLECWVNLSAIQGGFFGHGVTVAQQGLHITIGANYTRFGMYGDDTDFTLPHATGTWAHYVFTYNHSTYVKQAYMNGISYTGTLIQAQTPYTATPNTLRVGQLYSAISAAGLSGKVAVARLYNKVLTSDEISQNFNALRGRFGI